MNQQNGEWLAGNSMGEVAPLTDSMRGKLFRDAFNYFLSKVVPGLMGLLSVLVFVRLVGYEQYGRYAVVFAFVMAWASGMAGGARNGVSPLPRPWGGPGGGRNFLRPPSGARPASRSRMPALHWRMQTAVLS